MTEPWLFSGTPDPQGPASVTVMEGTTFCISDATGDLATVKPGGLFVRDTRMLATWDLNVGGHTPEPLTVGHETAYAVHCLSLVPGRLLGSDGDLLVTRHRVVGNGMREELTLHNAGSGLTTTVSLRVGTDFADLFEVKDGRAADGDSPSAVAAADELRIVSTRDSRFGVRVVPDDGTTVTAAGLEWTVELPPHGAWSVTLEVVPRINGADLELHHPRGVPLRAAEPYRRRSDWRAGVPGLETPDRRTNELLRRSVDDLGTLRIFDPAHPERAVVAAGAPWFMALFGRDSLITSLMLLPLDAGLALGTCQTLAERQGAQFDADSEEEPGRILHEVRMGPAGTLALGGRSAYFGTADATPLFVMTLGALLRWCGPECLTPDLIQAADRALEWIRTLGDRDGDGFVEYERHTARGLANQGWKDSWDGVNFADGRLAEPPIALAEVQAYCHAAFRARAEIADALGDPATAERCRGEADALRDRFEEAFWLPDRGWYAVGLNRDKRPIDALTSNVAHLLWTGMVDQDRARRIADHLMSPEVFCGWGIRTLARSMRRYDPLSYHNGSVWPHDTAICVAGLARYGFREEAARLASALLDAGAHFGFRLPELFGGFDREATGVPVPYRAACIPQAWAAAAPVELFRALLGARPGPDGLVCDPWLPQRLAPLTLTGVRCLGGLYSVAVDPDGTSSVVRREGGA